MNPRALLLLLLLTSPLLADGPADNQADKVRRVPPPGVPVPAAIRTELEAGAAELGESIATLRSRLKDKPALLNLLPDVQIYHNAVRYALTYDEFFKTNEFQAARELLEQGRQRVRSLGDGLAPWNQATGLVVRGYVSRIDGSVQPYGLVVPTSFRPDTAHRFRLDCWFHGRGETLTELDFLNGRQKSAGEFTPANALVLHLYGRYCNGDKFAGETDLFEALDDVRKHYPLDENRLVVRGFSLGGAACWHLATHYAGLWAAAAPGAGFSETPEFLKVFQNETVQPPAYEQKLWHLYNATDYAVNLFNCPTVAYSGENDRQKQAADAMAKALAAEGMELVHLIGPKTEHRYHPETKLELNRRIDSIVARGRNPLPDQVRFTTWTLRYNRMNWVVVDALEQHWERARVTATLDRARNQIEAKTANVSALTLEMPPGLCPLDATKPAQVVLDGQRLNAATPGSDRSWTAHFRKTGARWQVGPALDDTVLAKRHGLQGPIDDAFMDSFIMVTPTGRPLSEKTGAWVTAEQAHAIEQWRRQFRGEARVVTDNVITDAEIASSNLILWGDPQSNKLLARIADRLPLRWNSKTVQLGAETHATEHHVGVMIYPNPLNPNRYVVLNSGFTFREYDYLNNARQVPKLPDYAIVDVDVPVTSRAPGGIVTAGFFGEHWEVTGGKK